MAASFHLQRRVTLSRSPLYHIPFISALPTVRYCTVSCDQIVHVLASLSPNRVFLAFDVLDGVWHRVGEACLRGLRMMASGMRRCMVGTVPRGPCSRPTDRGGSSSGFIPSAQPLGYPSLRRTSRFDSAAALGLYNPRGAFRAWGHSPTHRRARVRAPWVVSPTSFMTTPPMVSAARPLTMATPTFRSID